MTSRRIRPVPLTARDLQVLAGTARGHTAARIAADLGLTPDIVKHHRTRIRHITGCTNAASVIDHAYRNGLLADLPPDPAPAGPLKPREQQVLEGIARGESDVVIGLGLWITEESVAFHAKRLFRTLGVRSRAHAVAIGYQHGLLPLPARAGHGLAS